MDSTLIRFESSGNTYKPLRVQLLLSMKGHFTIALWMPVKQSATTQHLWMDAVFHDKCQGMHRVSWRTLWALSAISKKLNVYGHVVRDILFCFGMWNKCPKFVHTFQLCLVDTNALLLYGCMLRWLACVDTSSDWIGSVVIVPNVCRNYEYS
jgi:hypothetical protein